MKEKKSHYLDNSRARNYGGCGKGDLPRKVDYKTWDTEWDRIFGKKKKPVSDLKKEK